MANALFTSSSRVRCYKGARSDCPLFRAMLAVILWHEMAHLDGAAERTARQAEEELWQRFVRDGVTDQVTALRYMQALRKRPDDLLLVALISGSG